MRAASDRVDAISRRVGRLVSERPADGMELDGWSWTSDDDDRPEAGIERLLGSAASLDARRARDRVDALRSAYVSARVAAEERETCER